MLRFEDYENTYWCDKGKYQKEYDEMIKANFEFTKTSENIFYHYNRFYNDGDTPTRYRYDEKGYAKLIEEKVNDRILKEYKRFKKGIK